MKKNAILTFDYEVFLGQQTGTIEKSVIKRHKNSRSFATKDAKTIFFVDATWLLF